MSDGRAPEKEWLGRLGGMRAGRRAGRRGRVVVGVLVVLALAIVGIVALVDVGAVWSWLNSDMPGSAWDR